MKGTFFDGQHMKGFNIPMSFESDFGWDLGIKPVQKAELYTYVSVVYRAFNLDAYAKASVPFALVTKAGADFDISADWQNKVGFMPNPRKLFELWHKSIGMTNAGYALFDGVGEKTRLRYAVPTTITPDADDEKGLLGFWRQVGAKRIYYPVKSNKIVWMFRQDYDSEILPSENTDFKAVMESAGVLYYADHFVRQFFQRGGIKATMLMVKGAPTPEERERMENIWDKLMRGMTKYIGKIFNAEAVEPHVIGAGVDDLKDNPIYDRAIDNVASVLGIPKRILMGSERGELASSQDTTNWFENRIVPGVFALQDELNANLFDRLGLKLEFRPEEADPDQEREHKRSQSVLNYATILKNNGNPKANSLAFRIMGVDLPAGIDYEELDERDEELLAQNNPFLGGGGNDPQAQPGETDPDKEKQQNKSMTPAPVFVPNADQIKELKTWKDIAERKMKRDEWPFAWEAKYLPADIAGAIQERLEQATDHAGIKAAFDLNETPAPAYKSDDTAIFALAEAINRLGEKVTT